MPPLSKAKMNVIKDYKSYKICYYRLIFRKIVIGPTMDQCKQLLHAVFLNLLSEKDVTRKYGKLNSMYPLVEDQVLKWVNDRFTLLDGMVSRVCDTLVDDIKKCKDEVEKKRLELMLGMVSVEEMFYCNLLNSIDYEDYSEFHEQLSDLTKIE